MPLCYSMAIISLLTSPGNDPLQTALHLALHSVVEIVEMMPPALAMLWLPLLHLPRITCGDYNG